jgi:hypothetical protein
MNPKLCSKVISALFLPLHAERNSPNADASGTLKTPACKVEEDSIYRYSDGAAAVFSLQAQDVPLVQSALSNYTKDEAAKSYYAYTEEYQIKNFDRCGKITSDHTISTKQSCWKESRISGKRRRTAIR